MCSRLRVVSVIIAHSLFATSEACLVLVLSYGEVDPDRGTGIIVAMLIFTPLGYYLGIVGGIYRSWTWRKVLAVFVGPTVVLLPVLLLGDPSGNAAAALITICVAAPVAALAWMLLYAARRTLRFIEHEALYPALTSVCCLASFLPLGLGVPLLFATQVSDNNFATSTRFFVSLLITLGE